MWCCMGQNLKVALAAISGKKMYPDSLNVPDSLESDTWSLTLWIYP